MFVIVKLQLVKKLHLVTLLEVVSRTNLKTEDFWVIESHLLTGIPTLHLRLLWMIPTHLSLLFYPRFWRNPHRHSQRVCTCLISVFLLLWSWYGCHWTKNWKCWSAADDDPLPAIDGLQISGEAFPGQQLQACGYSINGTTSCNFEVLLLSFCRKLLSFLALVADHFLICCRLCLFCHNHTSFPWIYSGCGIWKMDLFVMLMVLILA